MSMRTYEPLPAVGLFLWETAGLAIDWLSFGKGTGDEADVIGTSESEAARRHAERVSR